MIWRLAGALLVVTLLTYYFYPLSIDRFLSSLALLITVLAGFMIELLSAANQGTLLQLIFSFTFAFQWILCGYLLTNGKVSRTFLPLSYALVISNAFYVGTIVLIGSVEISYLNQTLFSPYTLYFIKILIARSLILLSIWAAGGVKRILSTALYLITLFAVAFSLFGLLGPLLSILILILGHAKHDKILSSSGVFFLILFLSQYYYALQITLLLTGLADGDLKQIAPNASKN